MPDRAGSRRSSLQVRQQLLDAAETLFVEHGYTGVTTRDLARAAHVSESVLYRHFGSKSRLFAEAVLLPFARLFEAFSHTAARRFAEPVDLPVLMRLFVSELIDQLRAHRQTLRMFLAAEDELDADTREVFYNLFDEVIRKLSEVTAEESRLRNRPQGVLGPEMNVRATLGMAISLVVLDNWLLPQRPAKPTREQLVEHLSTLLLQGA